MRMSRRLGIYGGKIMPSTANFTGTSQFIDEGGGMWTMKFLTSGTFTPPTNYDVDIFIVGGGAGGQSATNNEYTVYGGMGGSGGKTSLATNIEITSGTGYTVTVGAGGSPSTYGTNKSGGQSVFGSYTAAGGYFNGIAEDGSNNYGGSGGGGGTHPTTAGLGNGGSDGSNGYRYQSYAYGKGMGTYSATGIYYVREFRESGGKLYAGGGGAGAPDQSGSSYAGAGGSGGGGRGGYGTSSTTYNGAAGTANTGGGGGGGTGYTKGGRSGGKGGSGIVIIRSHR